MRGAPAPQPSHYLGDDPDLTAELAQRLAATAQTGQGLLTNYLFYGQRHATEQRGNDERERRSLDGGAGADVGRADTVHSVSGQADHARHDLAPQPGPGERPIRSIRSERRGDVPRLRFRVVESQASTPGPRDTPGEAMAGDRQPLADHLAVDGLADDPHQRDPLADPRASVLPNVVTLDTRDRGQC